MTEPMSDNQQVFRDTHGKIVEIIGQESIADAFHRLQTENAAMREIVRDVPRINDDLSPDHIMFCPACHTPVIQHRHLQSQDCIVVKCRALVAQWDTQEDR